MVIIEREGKYFLQLTNGELELSEKQAKTKLEKGAVLKEDVESAQEAEEPVELQSVQRPETTAAVQPQAEQPVEEVTDTHSNVQPETGKEEPSANTIWDAANADEPTVDTNEEQPSTIWDQSAENVEFESEVIEPATEITGQQPEVTEPQQTKAFEEPVIKVEEPVMQQEEPMLAYEEHQPAAQVMEKPRQPVRPTERRHSQGPSRPGSQLLPVNKVPNTAESFILSDEYYDSIIREFERVYVANNRKDETALELLEYCQKSINHLKIERAQPNADLALLDYQMLGWLRIIVFLQALTGVAAPKQPESAGEKTEKDRDIIKQMLVIQLLQETGAFPYADALKSITHDSIVGLISRILNKEKAQVKASMQRSGDILLRRNVTPAHAAQRLKLLTEVESYFSELPYNHVIIRLKSLKEFYKNYHLK